MIFKLNLLSLVLFASIVNAEDIISNSDTCVKNGSNKSQECVNHIETPDAELLSKEMRDKLRGLEKCRFNKDPSCYPLRTYVSAKTRNKIYVPYLKAWRKKVLRYGNLNFPNEAKKQNLSGNVLLEVAINKDGTIDEIKVRRSSGHKILDDAAIGITKLAAPYAPFTDDMKKETDILHIIETWKYDFKNNHNQSLKSRTAQSAAP